MSQNSSVAFKDKLRLERLERNWSQQDLADQLGTTVVTIHRWERGIQQPRPYFRLKLCILFGKSEADLGLYFDEVEESGNPTLAEQPAGGQALSATLPVLDPSIQQERESVSRESTLMSDQQLVANIEPALSQLPLSPDHQSASVSSSPQEIALPFFIKRGLKQKKLWISLIVAVLVIGGGASLLFASGWPTTHRGMHNNKPTLAAPQIEFGTLNGSILAFQNTLTQSNAQGQWALGNHCKFQDGSYYGWTDNVDYCGANVTDFQNFAYQIDVTLLHGPEAGIDFRADDNSDLYYLYIDARGNYGLEMIHTSENPRMLLQGHAIQLHEGYSVSNTIGVIATGSLIRIFFNHHEVGDVQDTTYARGYVGVVVGAYYDLTQDSPSQVTSASFHNAIVWSLP